MFPFTRFLRCLYVAYNRDFTKISTVLRSAGISASTELLTAYYDQYFLIAVPENLRSHFMTAGMHSLHPSILKSVTALLGINQYFINNKLNIDKFDNIIRNRLIQRHIECSFIGRLTPEMIYDDLHVTYNIIVPLEVIIDYRHLFADLTFVRDQKDWFATMRCYPKDEQVFRNAIIVQPQDYVRWKLGVAVHIDPQLAIKQIATDSFFKYKESLIDSSSAGLETTRRLADLAFKSIDRMVKLESIQKSPQRSKNFNALLLSFSEDNASTIDDLGIDHESKSDS